MASSDENSVRKRIRQPGHPAVALLWPKGLRGPAAAPARPFLHALRQTIQRDVIPRLVLAHTSQPEQSHAPESGLHMSAADARDCAQCTAECATRQDARGVRVCLDRALSWGLPLEQVYIQILGGAAGVLGKHWEQDTLNFLQVTIGMGVLQASLRELAQDHQHEAAGLASSRRVMLVPTPGECHSFGSSVVAEVFRHRGWNVESEFSIDCNAITGILRGEWFDVVGLSLGNDRNLHQLSETIRQIRRHSRNRRVGILVGGPAFANHPERFTCSGGDAYGTDAVNAVEQAGLLLGLLAGSSG